MIYPSLLSNNPGSTAIIATQTPQTPTAAPNTGINATTPTRNTPPPVSDDAGGDDGQIAAQNPPTSAQTPTPAPAKPTTTGTATAGAYKNGTYTGPVTDAYFGTVQVATVIQNGALANVQVLRYPSDQGTSRRISVSAMPKLVQEAIQSQSAQVNVISGATQTSQAFSQSLAAALTMAK